MHLNDVHFKGCPCEGRGCLFLHIVCIQIVAQHVSLINCVCCRKLLYMGMSQYSNCKLRWLKWRTLTKADVLSGLKLRLAFDLLELNEKSLIPKPKKFYLSVEFSPHIAHNEFMSLYDYGANCVHSWGCSPIKTSFYL